jgi:hypothetical protein
VDHVRLRPVGKDEWAKERELVPLAAVPEPCEPFVQVEDATTAEEFLDRR